jgi:hypothetical protein
MATTITITPSEKLDGSGWQYLVLLDPADANVWVKAGMYREVDEVLQAFSMPLSQAFRNAILIRLNEHKSIDFRLEDAFEVSQG